MPIFYLEDDNVSFPPAHLAHKDGIIAVGGDLSPERLLSSYYSGIFYWFSEGDTPTWWTPNPRTVIFPEKAKMSHSMKQILKSKKFTVTLNQNFWGVLGNCKNIPRPKQDGTWISDELIESLFVLHQRGFVHTIETWENNELVGGLYGICLGKCFFGESMFSKVSNASKTALLVLAKNMELNDFSVIDCQVETPHLMSLGAENISRKKFLQIIEKGSKAQQVALKDIFDGNIFEKVFKK